MLISLGGLRLCGDEPRSQGQPGEKQKQVLRLRFPMDSACPSGPEPLQDLHHREDVAGLVAALLTGTLAAVAAFVVSLPDRSRAWLLLPVPALLAWVSTIGYGCLTDWVTVGPSGVRLGETARCFATLVLTSLPLSLAMLMMLRHAAHLRPTAVMLTGILAVAAITATALSLFHDIDATLMILIWNLGTAALIVALGGLLGRRMFSWVALRPFPHEHGA